MLLFETIAFPFPMIKADSVVIIQIVSVTIRFAIRSAVLTIPDSTTTTVGSELSAPSLSPDPIDAYEAPDIISGKEESQEAI